MSAPSIKPVTAWALTINGAIIPAYIQKRKRDIIADAEAHFCETWKEMRRQTFRIVRVQVTAL